MEIKLNITSKRSIAEKILDLANIAAGALIFGQAISGFKYNWILAITGFFILIFNYTWVIIALGKSK
ncbi:MAG: hypothetical protein ABFQ62_04420 [Patescibacteria group bacterium]